MANAGGLLIVLVAGLVGLGLVFVTFGLLVYGLVAKDPTKGLRASVMALVLSVLGALLAFPFWRVVLTGHGSHGEVVTFRDDWQLFVLVLVQAAAIVSAGAGALRQATRRPVA